MDELRHACAEVAKRARSVGIDAEQIALYAASLPAEPPAGSDEAPSRTPREQLAAFWLTLDAVNFGSGWFPTLRKAEGRSGYDTIAAGVRAHGPWPAAELAEIDRRSIAQALGQDAGHELMELFAVSLRALGHRVTTEFGGRFAAVVEAAQGSAVALARQLGRWECFDDCSRYGDLQVPFLKRAQIAAADLSRAGAATFGDLDRLTMFADNLVPHVLRLDGILRFDRDLVARIEREELIEHGSPEEVEIRACALHAVELMVAARPETRAADLDQVLWLRGKQPRYKAVPRHRSRCIAY